MATQHRKLSSQEVAQANALGKSIGAAQAALTRARRHLDVAVAANVDQNSDRWNKLCDRLEAARQGLDCAVNTEGNWWRSKGFRV